MHQYELMVILDPTVEEKTVQPSLDKFLNVIRSAEGTIESLDIWGRRRLAYEIQKKTEGIYAVINMTATPASVVELDRQLRLSEAVMRTKVLRAEDVQFSIAPAKAEDKPTAEKVADATSEEDATSEKKPAAKKASEK